MDSNEDWIIHTIKDMEAQAYIYYMIIPTTYCMITYHIQYMYVDVVHITY